MMRVRLTLLLTLSSYLPAVATAQTSTTSWNSTAAAAYLDGRQAWWLGWPTAARDHNTACVSCHTVLPYALARPGLRATLAERAPPEPERKLIENVVKRVRMWREVEPFYPDQTRGLPKTSESRGTEAVLNAIVLANRDARSGGPMSADAKQAFDNLWALQFRSGDLKGAWAWLNFHNEPWEGNGSPYFGAALAAIAVGTAPGGYASTSDIQERLTLLRGYLQRGADTVSLFNRLMALWASGQIQSLLTTAQRQSIVDAAFAAQQSDGGWSTSTLGPWARSDGAPLDAASDGYATGLVALAVQRAGVARTDARLQRGIDWLTHHQDPASGAWFASSVNKKRDPATDVGKFMNDAATAFAVLALTYSP